MTSESQSTHNLVQTVGLVCALHKPGAVEFARLLVQRLEAAKVQILAEEELAQVAGDACQVRTRADLAAAADLVIAMGGDGTLLSVAHYAAPAGTPLLGVDLGSFGFLAAQPPAAVLENLEELLGGRYRTESRLMITAQVRRDDETVGTYLALNDIVAARTSPRRMIRLRATVDGELVAVYPADGLIVSTPTGSTAYNLSARGSVVSPSVDCLIINPICPHTLYLRPLVVQSTATVEISLESHGKTPEPISLTIDGQKTVDLLPEDTIVATQASCQATLVSLHEDSFYERLRTKLNWGAER